MGSEKNRESIWEIFFGGGLEKWVDFPAAAFNTAFGNREGHLLCLRVGKSYHGHLIIFFSFMGCCHFYYFFWLEAETLMVFQEL